MKMDVHPALNVESFQRWRRDCFYPKADLPLQDSTLRGEGLRPLDEAAVARACSQLLGQPVSLNPMEHQGTFHRLWRIRGKPFVVRANALFDWFRDYPLLIRAMIDKPRAMDLSRSDCRSDLMIEQEARGVSLRTYDDDETKLLPLLRDLGRTLAKVHRRKVERFGLFDVTKDGLIGSHPMWDEYLWTKLEAHVSKCVEIDAITDAEAKRILWIFDGCRGIFKDSKPSLLHGDPGSHNVFANEEDITLIDWEDALAGDPVYEIAFWATFHPERRHAAFLNGYCEVGELPPDFERRFWLYYVRVALAKTVLRHRLGLKDRPGREPAALRIRNGLKRLAACGLA